MSDEILTAVIAGGVALLVSLLTAVGGYVAARNRLRQEFRTQYMAEDALIRLLRHKGYKRRSFAALKSLVGGFEDDELRRLLVRAGAFRFTYTPDIEYWGLLDLNPEGLDIIQEKPKTVDNAAASEPTGGSAADKPQQES